MIARTFVHDTLAAWHTDPQGGEGRHRHVWAVTVYFASEARWDKRYLRERLREVLDRWEGQDLPAELWSDEALAEAIMGSTFPCLGVVIDRPGFGGADLWQ